MDKSADGEAPTTVATAVEEIQQQESSRVRRRLVQSTLLRHKSPAMETPGDQKDDNEVKDGDDEECSGSQGKKKRTRKRKESPQTRTPKVSRKAKAVSSAEATPEKDATPKKSKRSSINAAGRKSATPKKNGSSVGKIADYLTENSDALLQIPNLRLEAKMMAEENSRVFGGKQIHPFFMSRNTSKIGQKTAIQINSKSITVGPIHVFEREQDDSVSLDWRDWKFCEKFFTNSSFTLEGSFSSIFECTVKSLSFDEFPSVLHLTGSHFQDNKPSDECLPQQEFLYEASATAMSCGARVECDQQIKDAEINYRVNEVGLLFGCARKSDAEHQTKILEERVSSHPGCANQLDNRLWTFKYQPKKAMEICGNHDSVKFLNEWLCTWHQRGYEASKASSVTDECYMQDPDYNCSQSDSDSGNAGEEANFKNVLLITGPVGSGKSAAIYACAKEQGFRVLEFNTSECRNGAAVKERFGVLDSQSTLDFQLLQWSQESPLEFQTMDTIKPPAVVQEIDGKGIEVVPIADEDISHEATETSEKFVYKDSSVPCSQGQLKLLILFEDVDVIFSEDRGFLTAIQQISDKVKWPVILTTNSDKPVLPHSLDRLELCFKMPLEKELFQHLCMVCSAENADVQPHQVEQLIKICQRDIRKIIMHLQFWCQGEQFIKGNEVRRLFSRLPFVLEDVYQILPKMIPWDFPSQLSELVEKEITMSLCMMEENGVSTVVITDDKDMHNHMEKHICETDSIEAKKKVMLSNNCSDHDTIDFIPPFNLACDFFDSSNSPVPSSRKNSKRKLVVMSSDSEDDRVPTSLEKDISNGFFLDNGGFAPHHPNFQIGFSPSTDLQLYSESEKLEENLYLCSETAVHLDVKDTCISIDVSCVPESSYVPETEIDDGTRILFGRVSCGQMGQAEIIEETSVSNEFRQNILSVDAKNFDEPMPKLCKDSDLLGGTCDMTAVSPHEEVEDSQNDLTESITREHQLMDEYSCMDFGRNFNQHQKRGSSDVIDTVQESWRKLRDRRADLRHLAAAEHKYCSGIVKLACGMSNLISEAEVLQAKCQSLDSLGLPMVFSEESEAFGWGNEQLQMASTIVQHGFCTYAKDIFAAGLNMGYRNNGDSTWEVLSATTKMEVSNSLGQNVNAKNLHVGLGAEMTLLENGSSNSEQKSQSINIIQSVVPSRAYMTVKGDALYEYRSSLACISRSESSRLSEGDSKTRRRRGRAARNYLSTGSLMLSPEEISLLGQSSMHGKISPVIRNQILDRSI